MFTNIQRYPEMIFADTSSPGLDTLSNEITLTFVLSNN